MHPVRPMDASQARTIRCLRAAVTVRREKKNLVIVAGKISVLKIDALVVLVPDYLRVVSESGEVVMPSKDAIFLITTETVDPYHLITQIPRNQW